MSQTLMHKRTHKPFGVFTKPSPSMLSEDPEHQHRASFVRYVSNPPVYEGHLYFCTCGLFFVEPKALKSHIRYYFHQQKPEPGPVVVSGKMLLAALCCAAIVLIGAYMFIVEWFSL